MKMNTVEKYNQSNEQHVAEKKMLGEQNIFLTGLAGTGKSTIIRSYCEISEEEIVKLAPTGLAALNIGGETIHSFFGFPVGTIDLEILVYSALRNRELFEYMNVLLLDEVSMIPVYIFEAMDRVLRICGGRNKPFGGKKLICCGDYAQLPPVMDFITKSKIKQRFESEYAFHAPGWLNANFTNIVLKKIHRQSDPGLLNILNGIRHGDSTVLNELNRNCYRPNVAFESTYLCSTRDRARHINLSKIRELNDAGEIFLGIKKGIFPDDMMKVEASVIIKRGEKVMLAKNDKDIYGENYVNGQIGTVIDICRGWIRHVVVEMEDGKIIYVYPQTWYNCKYRLDKNERGKTVVKRKVIGTYRQIPIIPAWALTIHKSQGKSLNAAHLIPGRSGYFANYQLYVGASRVRTLKGLTFNRPVTSGDLKVSEEVIEFHNKIGME
jgi:ATP-dependent DNA helicase PIF1